MLTACGLPQTIIAEKAFPDNVFRREDIPVYIHLNFFIMFDLSSIILKIDDLKAKVENDSITPTCLGSLLDGIVAAIRDIDMTDYKQTIVSSKNDAEKALDDAAKATNIASAAQDKAIANAGNITTIAANLEKLKQTVNTLYGQNATDAIESFNEVIDFLAGLKDDESLALLLSDINTRIVAVNTTLEQLAARIATEEDQRNDADEILNAKVSKALIASDRFVRFDGILDQEHDAEFVPPGVYFFNDQKRFGRTNGRDVDFGAFDGYELFDEPDLHVYYDNVFKLYNYDGNVLNPYVVSIAGKGLSANDYTDEDKAKLGALPTKAELDISLGAKLDKSKWDEEHGQFTVVDRYINIDGKAARTQDASCTEFICLNRKYDIRTDAKSFADTVYVITFYDSRGKRISGYRTQDLTYGEDGFATLATSEFPEAAAYIRLSQYQAPFNHAYKFTNGPSIESREGAVSEAIQASITAAVDETLIAEATAAGAVFNRTSRYFELNGLTDITAKQMRTILAAGARQSSTLPWAYVSSTIRTHLPRVGIGQAANAVSTFRSCPFLETVEMPNMILQGEVFFNCNQLRSVNWKGTPIYDLNNTANANFQGCSKLVELRGALRGNFDFNIADSPLLSLASFQYMVDHAYNKSAITVTVHPTVYGKLTDEQADIMALLPENLLTGLYDITMSYGVTIIDNGVEVTAPKAYFRIKHSPRLVDGGIGKLTVSCDVEGLQDGESISLAVGAINSTSRPSWTISANGRSVFSFDASKYSNDSTNKHSFLLYDVNGTYTGQSVKLTNFKLSYGEHDALPYTAPLSSITDDATREKAEWLSLMQIAEAKNINFVTTE